MVSMCMGRSTCTPPHLSSLPNVDFEKVSSAGLTDCDPTYLRLARYSISRILFLCLLSFSQMVMPQVEVATMVGMSWFMSDINQPSLPTPFYSVLVFISVFMALSTVFHSINFPDNSSLSHPVPPVLFLPYWSFQLYISLRKSPSAPI